MKRLLLLVLLISSVHGQIYIQRILSEETIINQENGFSVTHVLTNHRNESITDIRIYEKLPSGSTITSCSHCNIEGTTLIVEDIPAHSTLNVSYTADLPAGEHTLNLGHKTYIFNGQGQERVGQDYEVSIDRKLEPWVLIPLVLAVLAWWIFRK